MFTWFTLFLCFSIGVYLTGAFALTFGEYKVNWKIAFSWPAILIWLAVTAIWARIRGIPLDKES